MLYQFFLTISLLSLYAVGQVELENFSSEFIVGFAPGVSGFVRDNLVLFISAVESDPVQVNVQTLTGFSFTGTATNTETLAVQIPISLEVGSSTERNKGILVTSEDEKNIVVYGLSYQRFTTDAFLALPCDRLPVLQYEYYAMSYDPIGQIDFSFILVVGCEDDTVFTIGSSSEMVLNRMQTYYVQNAVVTGTRIISDKPLVVYSGCRCAFVPLSFGACDHIVQQIPPTATWGTNFMSASLAGRGFGDIYRIMASESFTSVSINCTIIGGVSTYNLATPGSFQEIMTPDNSVCFISSDKPILVNQFGLGAQTDDGGSFNFIGDPFMMMIPPVEQYSNNYVFIVPSQSVFNYMTVYVTIENFQPESIFIDDSNLSSNSWNAIYCDSSICGYTTDVVLAVGDHRLYHSATSSRIGISVYGFSFAESYGYPGGLRLEILQGDITVRNVTVSPEVICAKRGRNVSFTCYVGEGDNFTFSWENVSNGDIVSVEEVLSVTALHGTMYRCTVMNDVSTEIANTTLYVSPRLVRGPKDMTVCEGESVYMTCVFEGETIITWFHNGKEIKQTYNTYVEESVNDDGFFSSTLIIREAEYNDSGHYSCKATTGTCHPVTANNTLNINASEPAPIWLWSLLRGPSGLDGRDGEKGNKGENGKRGDAGSPGDIGTEKGNKGSRGLIGLPGPSGYNGAKGKKGERGDPGDEGVSGVGMQGGAVYTAWGLSKCPEISTTLLEGGLVSVSPLSVSGSGANYLCLPTKPTFSDSVSPDVSVQSPISGVIYSTTGEPLESNNGRAVPCSVCFTSHPVQLMIPGRASCPGPKWRMEYNGYLMSSRDTPGSPLSTDNITQFHFRTEYICVSSETVGVSVFGSGDDSQLFHVHLNCEEGMSLKCSDRGYTTAQQITCAVCSRVN